MSAPTSKPREESFVPEKFCDEVYDYMDDNLAEAMDDLEKELLKAVPKAAGAGDAADGGNSGEDRSVEEAIKTCCDTMQNSLQREFDRNLDLFDFCVKKAVSGATASAREAAAESASAAMGAAPGNKGVSPSDNSAGVTLGATNASREGVRDSTGGDPTSCKRGGSRDEWRDSEMEEGAVPKRLEDEKALDAEIHRLRKRRREALNRCEAMIRKGAREKTVLQDVSDYVEALQMGVSNSFDDNGLTPVPAKVQEAVQSSAALRVTADRAQELTRRLEREMKERVTGGGGESGGGSSAAGVVTAPPPRDLQAIYQRSREEEVVSGDARDNATLEARLRG
ncbi:unnamed protein product [Ascophyllum nodosum]